MSRELHGGALLGPRLTKLGPCRPLIAPFHQQQAHCGEEPVSVPTQRGILGSIQNISLKTKLALMQYREGDRFPLLIEYFVRRIPYVQLRRPLSKAAENDRLISAFLGSRSQGMEDGFAVVADRVGLVESVYKFPAMRWIRRGPC